MQEGHARGPCEACVNLAGGVSRAGRSQVVLRQYPALCSPLPAFASRIFFAID